MLVSKAPGTSCRLTHKAPLQPWYQIPAVDAQYAAVVHIFPILFSTFNLQDSAQKAWICTPAFCKGLEERVNFKDELFDEEQINKQDLVKNNFLNPTCVS